MNSVWLLASKGSLDYSRLKVVMSIFCLVLFLFFFLEIHRLTDSELRDTWEVIQRNIFILRTRKRGPERESRFPQVTWQGRGKGKKQPPFSDTEKNGYTFPDWAGSWGGSESLERREDSRNGHVFEESRGQLLGRTIQTQTVFYWAISSQQCKCAWPWIMERITVIHFCPLPCSLWRMFAINISLILSSYQAHVLGVVILVFKNIQRG